MPTLQAFEADTLEAALARVTEEVGHGARITQAEKVRTGGVAGFFARERFEVTVEIDDDAPGRPAPAPTPDPASAEPMSLLDLADQVSHQERSAADRGSGRGSVPSEPPAPEPDAHQPSTESRTFQEVLRGIAGEAGLFDTEPSEVSVPAERAQTPVPVPAEDRPADAMQSTGPAPTDEIAPALTALGIPEPLLGSSLDGLSVTQRLLGALEQLPRPRPVIARHGDVAVVIGPEPVAMEAAGQMAEQVGLSPADVILASLDAGGPTNLRTPEEAARHAEVWRSCTTPFVVAITPPDGAAGLNWLRWMVRSLDPVATWAAVRADRKPEDVAMWVERLGGIDALAVGACAETCSPASVLTTGIPVASIDGQRATPLAWTTMLTERLTDRLAA